MKKTQLVLGLLVAFTSLTTVASAQMKEGKISYERKINMHRNLPDPQMKSMVPEFRTDKFELIFNENVSLFRSVVDEEAPDPFANAGGGGGGGAALQNVGGAGGSGVVILRFPNTRTITIGAGLTGSTAADGSNTVATITAGTGNVSWA